LNPLFSALIEYTPGLSGVAVYSPNSFVVAPTVMFVSVFATFTVAPITTAPDESTTVPTIRLESTCAQHSDAVNPKRKRRSHNEVRKRFSIPVTKLTEHMPNLPGWL
jgi:hypothetical protein